VATICLGEFRADVPIMLSEFAALMKNCSSSLENKLFRQNCKSPQYQLFPFFKLDTFQPPMNFISDEEQR